MDIKYSNNNFRFIYRVSALIYNIDKTKILLFNVNGNNQYLIPGGKIKELKTSIEALKREIIEELGFKNIEYSFIGVSEEFVNDKGYNNHQLNLIYKGIYRDSINKLEFKVLEGNWIDFKWVNIKDINKYNIFPNLIKEMIKDDNKIYHGIENKIGENNEIN